MSVPTSGSLVAAAPDHRTAVAQVVLGVLVGVLWAGRRVRSTYFYFDEWSMIGNVTHYGPFEGATTSFNGHLWFFQDMIFRIQANVFGLDSNRFLVVVFLVSLASLHLALTALAVRIGVPLIAALLLGGLLTYLGPAAQNFVFAIQLSPTFATAAAVGSTAIVLGGDATRRRCVVVAGLLLLAVLFDSGVGLLAIALGGGAVLGLWPRRRWWVLSPAACVTAVWYLFGDLGPQFEASIGDRIAFAGRLVARGAGALAGGGGWVGSIVLVGFASAAMVALASGRIDRAGRTVMLAAGAATVINVAGIAQSRGGLDGFSFFENNRYLQNVAIPLMITFLPAIVVCGRLIGERWDGVVLGSRIVRSGLPVFVLIAAFVLGLDEESDYAEEFIDRTEQVRKGVRDISVVDTAGCPSGQPRDLDARALGPVSPQISARLIRELTDRGLLVVERRSVDSVDPAILAAICGP